MLGYLFVSIHFQPFFIMKTSFILIIIPLILTACKSFTSKPLNLIANEQAWLALSQQQAQNGSLKLSQARQLGLAMNPTLNEARLKHLNSRDIAKNSGWWQDPSISSDALRVFGDSPNKYALAGDIDLVIPVTGIPALEKKIANQYKEADFWALRQAEADFLTQIDQAWGSLYLAQQRLNLTSKRASDLQSEETLFQKLYLAGESSLITKQQASSRMNDVKREKQSAEQAYQVATQKLVELIGLHPKAASYLKWNANASSMGNSISPTAEQLLQSPKLLSKMAQYGASETSLRAEIRKQFPELSIGPRYDREEGANRFGGGIGFNVPLWNRNRQKIAETSGARESAYLETINLWRGLLTQTQQWSAQRALIQKHVSSEQARLNNYKQQLQLLEKLRLAGEVQLEEVSETRQQAYESELALIQSYETLINLNAQLRNIVPTVETIKSNQL